MDNPITEADLAGRGARFGAALLDGLIVFAIGTVIAFVLGLHEGAMAGDVSTMVIYWLIGVVVYGTLNGHLLAKRGQTIGKRIVGIRIVCGGDRVTLKSLAHDNNGPQYFGAIPPLWKSFGLRLVVVSFVSSPVLIGPFALPIQAANLLLIFRKQRQCGHDILAGTIVVNADWVKPATLTESGQVSPNELDTSTNIASAIDNLTAHVQELRSVVEPRVRSLPTRAKLAIVGGGVATILVVLLLLADSGSVAVTENKAAQRRVDALEREAAALKQDEQHCMNVLIQSVEDVGGTWEQKMLIAESTIAISKEQAGASWTCDHAIDHLLSTVMRLGM